MMDRILRILTVSVAFLGAQIASTAALAQETAPDGILTGDILYVEDNFSFTLHCELTLTLDADDSRAEFSTSPGDPHCSHLTFQNMPYATSYSPGVLTIYDVHLGGVGPVECGGNISGEWDGSYLFTEDALPPVNNGPGGCKIYVSVRKR